MKPQVQAQSSNCNDPQKVLCSNHTHGYAIEVSIPNGRSPRGFNKNQKNLNLLPPYFVGLGVYCRGLHSYQNYGPTFFILVPPMFFPFLSYIATVIIIYLKQTSKLHW